MAQMEQEPRNSFAVRIEDPHKIFLLVRNQLPFSQGLKVAKQPEDLDNSVLSEQLSQTELDGIFDSEETRINFGIEEGGAFWSGFTVITLPESPDPLNSFYSSERAARLAESLQQLGSLAHVVDVDDKRQTELHIFGENSVAVRVGLGFKSLEAFAQSRIASQKRIALLQRGVILNEEEAIARAHSGLLNDYRFEQIMLSLDSGDENGFGNLDFRDNEQEFDGHLRFYARVYENVIRALCTEKGTALPKVPIILKSPYNISTRLNLEE